jgi:hypothetical protein
MSDKAFAPPKPADTHNKDVRTVKDAPPSALIKPGDWQAANAKHQDGKGTANVCDCKIVGKLDEKEIAKTVEELSKATDPKKQLAALGKLADGGVDKFSMKDKDGTTRQFRLETEKVGESTLLHCYGVDSNKAEQVVMRALRAKDGTFNQQRFEDDRLASFHGDKWSRSMAGKSFLVGAVEKSDHQTTQKQKSDDGDMKSKKTEKHESSPDREVGGKSRASQSESSNGKHRSSRDEESHVRSRKSETHRREERDSDSRNRRVERHDKSDRDSSDRRDRDDRPRIRFNLLETLGDVARVATPFLLSAIGGGRRQCNDDYYYQRQRMQFDDGYRDYQDYGRFNDNHYRRNDYGFGNQGGNYRFGNERGGGCHSRNYYDDNRGDHRHNNNRRQSSNWFSKIFR